MNLDEHKRPVSTVWRKFLAIIFTPRTAGIFLAFLAIALGAISKQKIDDLFAGLTIEIASIAITVLIIDALYDRRAINQKKQQLIRELGSQDRGTSLRALVELREEGWLRDGSLAGAILSWADLHDANLEGANLSGAILGGMADRGDEEEDDSKIASFRYPSSITVGANLCGALLLRADLRYANLNYANLERAVLDGALLRGASLFAANLHNAHGLYPMFQLSRVHILMRAIMPDGTLYDGRLNLPGDLEFAKEVEYDKSQEAMAFLYGVPVQQYIKGQEWAKVNLNSLLDETQYELYFNQNSKSHRNDKGFRSERIHAFGEFEEWH